MERKKHICLLANLANFFREMRSNEYDRLIVFSLFETVKGEIIGKRVHERRLSCASFAQQNYVELIPKHLLGLLGFSETIRKDASITK